MKTILLAGALCALAIPAFAQDAAQLVPITAPATTNAILRAGTPITLRFMEEITTQDRAARIGQRIRMEVAAPVEVNGVVVIPAGSVAEGEVTGVRNKGMWGRSGHLDARALFVRVNGRQIRLSGAFDDKGVSGTAAVVGALIVIPIAGFFVTGTSAVLPMGGEVNAFLDEDVQLAMAAATLAPLQVNVPAAAPAPAPAQAVVAVNAIVAD